MVHPIERRLRSGWVLEEARNSAGVIGVIVVVRPRIGRSADWVWAEAGRRFAIPTLPFRRVACLHAASASSLVVLPCAFVFAVVRAAHGA